MSTDALQPLVDDARSGLSRMESQAFARTTLDATTTDLAVALVHDQPDHSAYLVLLTLRAQARDRYDQVPPPVRAGIFCGALGHARFLNDFGYLDVSESYDGSSAKALLATGEAAVPCLRALLEDDRDAPLMGSEEATLSSLHAYRRSDFAYRYLCLLTGREPVFRSSRDERDADIAALVADLPAP